jgi:ribulose-phosphate 3-epimerase
LCDFGNLEREIRALEAAGVQGLHLDVMDGHFVPNLTYGMPIVAALRKLTDLPLDVHLMITDPAKYASQFVEAGADTITFHVEVCQGDDALALLKRIQGWGVAAGVAINPSTEFSCVENVAHYCDLLLVMSVEAGFGGQEFQPTALQRLQSLRRACGESLLLEVDGGVNARTISQCAQHGADLLVVGSAIFRQPDYRQAMARLAQAMHSAV